MATPIRMAVAQRRAPPTPLPPRPEPGAGLLENLGSVEDEDHILVIGNDGPDLMCALLRRGATQVTHLRRHERPEAASASLVIVPNTASPEWLARALPAIHRALLPNGRLVLAIAATSTNAIRRVLASHGFAAIRTRNAADYQVFTAERPAFDLRRCA